MLCEETVAVYCENRTEHTGTLCGKGFGFLRRVVRILTTGL
jgi:translation initiation factor IF-1